MLHPSFATRVSGDRLNAAKRRPALVERVLQTALRDAIHWRIGGGAAPSPNAFATAARSTARRLLDERRADPTEYARTLAATLRAAHRLTRSALWRRLMTIGPEAFAQAGTPALGPEAIVRDRRRRLHLISVAVLSTPLEAARRATRIAAAAQLRARDRLSPLTVHVFSLTTGTRHAFVREALPAPAAVRPARVA